MPETFWESSTHGGHVRRSDQPVAPNPSTLERFQISRTQCAASRIVMTTGYGILMVPHVRSVLRPPVFENPTMDPTSKAATTLAELTAGDTSATAKLLPLVYDELRSLAAGWLKRNPKDHTLQPTALVHEAYLRLVDQSNDSWQNRAHFI